MASKKTRKAATLGLGVAGGGFIPATFEAFRQNSEGAKSGALMGAQVGAAGGPFGALVGAGFGAVAGGFGAFGGNKKLPEFDIQPLINQINAKIAQLGELQKQQVRRQVGQKRRGVASNLASRGILRSGVSENVFGQLRQQGFEAEASIDQSVLEQQASATSNLAGKGALIQNQQQRADAQAAQQRNAAQFGQLGAIASAILQNKLAAGSAGGKSLNPSSAKASTPSSNFVQQQNNPFVFGSQPNATGFDFGRSQKFPQRRGPLAPIPNDLGGF